MGQRNQLKSFKYYHVAGKAAEQVKSREADMEDIIARKVFHQFQFSSVKVNSQSVTIKTEKSLNSTWLEILISNLGQPIDKGGNGKKFTFEDKCADPTTSVYITLYHTGNLLVQAQGNKQSINIHFFDCHLQDLFMQVYIRAKLQNKLPRPSLHPISITILHQEDCQSHLKRRMSQSVDQLPSP